METDGPTVAYPDTEFFSYPEFFSAPYHISPLVNILGGRSEGKEEVLEGISQLIICWQFWLKKFGETPKLHQSVIAHARWMEFNCWQCKWRPENISYD